MAENSSTFIPTTERVRDRFIAHSEITHSHVSGLGAVDGRDDYAAAFDRWLVQTLEAANPAEYSAAFDRWFAHVLNERRPRVITTEAEYAALPIGSIVRSNGHYGQVAERVDETEDPDSNYRWIYTGGGKGAFEHATIARNLGEATVLFTPPAAVPGRNLHQDRDENRA